MFCKSVLFTFVDKNGTLLRTELIGLI